LVACLGAPCTSYVRYPRTSYTGSIPVHLQTMLSVFISLRLLVVKFFKVGALYNRGSYSIYCVPHGYVKRLGVFHIGNRFVSERKVNSLQQQHRGSNTRFPLNLTSNKTIIFKLLPTLPAPPFPLLSQPCEARSSITKSYHYFFLITSILEYEHIHMICLYIRKAITSRTSYSLIPSLDLSQHAADLLVSYQVYHLS
jgi:hypothetical protein